MRLPSPSHTYPEPAQAELAEDYGVAQPTISRAISSVSRLLITVLADFIPVADEFGDGKHYVVNGSLLPYRSWQANLGLWSGKQKAGPAGNSRRPCRPPPRRWPRSSSITSGSRSVGSRLEMVIVAAVRCHSTMMSKRFARRGTARRSCREPAARKWPSRVSAA